MEEYFLSRRLDLYKVWGIRKPLDWDYKSSNSLLDKHWLCGVKSCCCVSHRLLCGKSKQGWGSEPVDLAENLCRKLGKGIVQLEMRERWENVVSNF